MQAMISLSIFLKVKDGFSLIWHSNEHQAYAITESSMVRHGKCPEDLASTGCSPETGKQRFKVNMRLPQENRGPSTNQNLPFPDSDSEA